MHQKAKAYSGVPALPDRVFSGVKIVMGSPLVCGVVRVVVLWCCYFLYCHVVSGPES